MNNFNNPTDAYLEEHKRVFSLPRYSIPSSSKRVSIAFNIFSLIKRNIISILKYLYLYPKQLIIERQGIRSLLKFKGIGNGRKVLVLGNGPSQGYLDLKSLKTFLDNGNDIIAVNYWNQNRTLSEIAPTYLVLSDPSTIQFNTSNTRKTDANNDLCNYLEINPTIICFVPIDQFRKCSKYLGENRVKGFIDIECRGISSNISPLFPRGYVSMTLYKALAIACYAEYNDIYVLGMDNTYPRNIYCDPDGKVCNVETHAGIQDYLSDQSTIYPGIPEALEDVLACFLDLRLFSKTYGKKIQNLDKYSLTDAFIKSKKNIDEVLSD